MGNSGVVMGRVLVRRLRRRASGESGEAVVEFAALTVLAAIIVGLVVATPTLATAQKWTARATAKILDTDDPTGVGLAEAGGLGGIPTGHGAKVAVAAAMTQRCVPYYMGIPPVHPRSTGSQSWNPAPANTSCSQRKGSAQVPTSYQWWFDCSSLVMWAWRHAGVSLPRTAQAQYDFLRKKGRAGPYTGEDDLRPGDLIFYDHPSIGHVVMYIGNGQIIEAPHTGAWVHVTNFYTSQIAGVGRPG